MVKFKMPVKRIDHTSVSVDPMDKKVKVNNWIGISLVLAVLLVVSFFTRGFGFYGSSDGAKITADDAGQKIVDFAAKQGATAELVNVSKQGSLYLVIVRIQNQEVPVYVTADGSNLVPSIVPLNAATQQPSTNSQTASATPTLPKSDKPNIELFVMSHCPYGTQEEKGFLPVAKLLGDKIDFNIKFVYYAMHGEKEVYEELNQYCIMTEQKDKYLNYLTCFLEDGDGTRCIAAAGIDASKLKSCTTTADAKFDVTKNFKNQSSWLSGQFPLMNFHKADNDKYSVGGSPTLVINGVEAQVARDSATLLKTVCAAFNTAPSECDTKFDSAAPSPGFGYGTAQAGNNQIAGCGY